MRGLLAALLLLALLAPAAAQTGAAGDAVILVYHSSAAGATRDPGATNLTPQGIETARLPFTRADGILVADTAPEGNPDSATAHARELQRLLNLRAATGAPVVLDMTGTATPGALHVEVTATEQGLAGAAEVRLVIVEDQVPLDEGGASRLLRYVVRADASAERVDLASPASFARDMPLPADVDATRVLVVAYVRVLEGAGTYEPGEVVQSATWSPRQSEPTHQVSKRVLVEHATATWCEPCHPSDDAIDLLAARSSQAVGSESYLHVPSPAGLAGLAMGAGAAVFLWRRRAA